MIDLLDGVASDEASDVAIHVPMKHGFHIPSKATSAPLYLDIETIPDFSRESTFGFDPIPDLPPETSLADLLSGDQFVSQSIDAMKQSIAGKNPPACWVEEVREAEGRTGKKVRDGVMKLLSELEGQKNANVEARQAQLKTMSLTPEYLKIVAIGLAVGGDEIQTALAETDDDEAEMLDSLWRLIAKVNGPIIGFNVLGFDLPAIFVRSCLLHVTPTRRLDMRPWGKDVIDVMEARFPRGNRAKPMKELSRLYGIENETEGVDGSQVLRLWNEDREQLRAYLKSDIHQTRRLHLLWSGFFC